MEDTIETTRQSPVNFYKMITFYEKYPDEAMDTLSRFLVELWKAFQGGNIDNPQTQKKENIESTLANAMTAGFEYSSSDDSGQKEFAMKVNNAVQAVIDQKPSLFIENICSVYGIMVGGEAFIAGKRPHKEIDTHKRILQPRTQSTGGRSKKIIVGTGTSVLEVMNNMFPPENKKTKIETPEWVENLTLNLTQQIQEFKELCKNLPIPVLENLTKFQLNQKELDFLRHKIGALNSKRNRHHQLLNIVEATKKRTTDLRENNLHGDQRRKRRLKSNEKNLSQQSNELFAIKIRELTPELKKLEIRFRTLSKQQGGLLEGLQYTQGDLRRELSEILGYRIPKQGNKVGQVINMGNLQSKAIGIITQISYELFPEWKGVRDTLTRLESQTKSGFTGEGDDGYVSQNQARKVMHLNNRMSLYPDHIESTKAKKV